MDLQLETRAEAFYSIHFRFVTIGKIRFKEEMKISGLPRIYKIFFRYSDNNKIPLTYKIHI